MSKQECLPNHFLFAGWDETLCLDTEQWQSGLSVFTFETDNDGDRTMENSECSSGWKHGKAFNFEFDENTSGEWIRTTTDKTTVATVHFSYSDS